MRVPRPHHLLTPVLAVLAGLAAAPATSQAAATFVPCSTHPHFECATVDVPLDRSGQVPGTIPLHVEREIGTGGRSVAFIGLAGGPGQSSAALAESTWRVLGSPVADRDQIVTFDQRGTGQSGLVDCTTSFRQARNSLDAAARCGDSLGAGRPFYTTADSVADIEAVRQAVGADQVTLMGVSYGTYVAERYARAYPDRVASLVLDSTVPLSGVQQWNAPTYAAIPGILRALCADDACPFTRDPVADLRSVARSLDAKPRTGTFVTAAGRRVTVRLRSAEQLYDLLLAGDFSPAARAFLPGALSAARQGDWAPLIRLVGLVSQSQSDGLRATTSQAAESDGLYLATTCTDIALPWSPSSPAAGRGTALRTASNALSASTFGPFDRATVLDTSVGATCLSWPATAATPYVDPGTPLNVPTLLLSGGADLRTPTSQATAARADFPNSALVTVPGVGHFVLGNDPTGCAATAYKSFLAGQTVGTPCAGKNGANTTQNRPPLRLTDVPTLGAAGTAGRIARVAARTMVDALTSAELTTPSDNRTRLGGLRGGTISVTLSTTQELAALSNVQYLPGMKVSGTVRLTAAGVTAWLRVDGGQASSRGTITIRDTRLTGRIGGHRIAATAGSRASAARVGAASDLVVPRFRGPGVDIG